MAFRDRLINAFNDRRSANSKFSIRAMATLLNTDHATLSQILRGTRKVPVLHLRSWAKAIGLTTEETSIYIAAEQTPPLSTTRRESLYRQWATEGLALINDPTHWHIIRLTREPGFQADSRWLAAQANSTVDQVNMAFSRLLRLQLLTANAPDHWTETTGLKTFTQSEFQKLALSRIRKNNQGKPKCPTP